MFKAVYLTQDEEKNVSAEIAHLDEADLTAITHEISWDGRTNAGLTLSDGVYFALIDFEGNRTRVDKIAVINEK